MPCNWLMVMLCRITPESFWLKVHAAAGEADGRAGLHARHGGELPAFESLAHDRAGNVAEEVVLGAEGQFVHPVHLDGLADVEGRGRFVVAHVAQRGVAAADALGLFVGDGMAPDVAALEEQALGHAALQFDLQAVIVGVAAVDFEVGGAGGQGGVDLEQIDRVAGGGQAGHAGGVGGDGVGQRAGLSLLDLQGAGGVVVGGERGEDDGQRLLSGQSEVLVGAGCGWRTCRPGRATHSRGPGPGCSARS